MLQFYVRAQKKNNTKRSAEGLWITAWPLTVLHSKPLKKIHQPQGLVILWSQCFVSASVFMLQCQRSRFQQNRRNKQPIQATVWWLKRAIWHANRSFRILCTCFQSRDGSFKSTCSIAQEEHTSFILLCESNSTQENTRVSKKKKCQA